MVGRAGERGNRHLVAICPVRARPSTDHMHRRLCCVAQVCAVRCRLLAGSFKFILQVCPFGGVHKRVLILLSIRLASVSLLKQ